MEGGNGRMGVDNARGDDKKKHEVECLFASGRGTCINIALVTRKRRAGRFLESPPGGGKQNGGKVGGGLSPACETAVRAEGVHGRAVEN